MSIITISRCFYSHGKDIAEAVAKTLGYMSISGEEFLCASQKFNLPGIKLARELPIILEQTISNKNNYAHNVRSALFRNLTKDNIVYHGFCGHVFLKNIDHVLKVQITSDIEDRAQLVMGREGCTRNEALFFIKMLDDACKKWCQKLYKIDPSKLGQYDISLNISKFPRDRAMNIICKVAQLNRFQTTPESKKAMSDLFNNMEIQPSEFSDNDLKCITSMKCLLRG